jgi:hypothetical protein
MSNITNYSDNYNFTCDNLYYKINEISILLELKRFQLIKEIKKECIDFFTSRQYLISAVDIIPRWMMLNLPNTKNSDPLLPFNGLNNTQLKKDLYYFLDQKYTYAQIDTIINELNLTEKFNNAIQKLQFFLKSTFYKNNKNNITVDLKLINDFYYFKLINVPKDFDIMFEIKLHKTVYQKLSKKYIKSDIDQITLICCIIIRYQALESYNQQLAVNPDFYKYLRENYNVEFELFGSSINCFFKNYCSLFYDLEKYFGSKGYFNFIHLKKGFYVANPPFDEQIMKNMSLQFINFLDKSKFDLSILITIPVWDVENYGLYEALDILKKSKYVKYIENMKKKRTRFYDYYKNKADISPCNIYFILLQNKKGEEKYNIKDNLKNILLHFFPNN